MNFRKIFSGAALALAALAAQAFQISSLSPQGEVARIRQVAVKFDEAAVAFGDLKATAPVTVSCSDARVSKGTGRWTGEREWVFDFAADLPPGVACTVQVRPGLRSVKNTEFTGPLSYGFNSGGPFVQSIRPYPDNRIDEEQFFTLVLNGPATTSSVLANVSCAMDGLGERFPVRLVEGKERAALLKSQGLEKTAEAAPLRFLTLTCSRRLTPSARVQLVFGKGVASPATGAGAVGVPAVGPAQAVICGGVALGRPLPIA